MVSWAAGVGCHQSSHHKVWDPVICIRYPVGTLEDCTKYVIHIGLIA